MIQLSKYDITRGLKFPKRMSAELAEETGIHVGDGCICQYVNNKGFLGYKYIVTSGGNEADYIEGYVAPLVEKVYGLYKKAKLKNDGTFQLSYDSKNLVKFKTLLGLPLGKKDFIKIPESVLNSNFFLDFLRGLMDTDGSLCFLRRRGTVKYYPRLAIISKSKFLILQVDSLLRISGFKTSVSLNCKTSTIKGKQFYISRVEMNGKENLMRWIRLIGFSNPKNIRKLEEWKTKGFIEK